jgi:hypothetical protein
MSLSEEKKLLLSQLVDGELPTDQANQLLADVLGELSGGPAGADAAGHLGALLRLRQALEPWRRQHPPKTIVALLPTAPARGTTPSARRALSLAAAALVGGILVAGGFFLRGQIGAGHPAMSLAKRPAVIVTPYAADDATIQVAPDQKGEPLRQPIAIVLRFVRDRSCAGLQPADPKTYVIVCRNGDAAVQLPASAVAKSMRVRLLPTAVDGTVRLQYAIAADGANSGGGETALAGSRRLDLNQTPLGQLALNDCLVTVDASAWVIAAHAR